MVKTVGLEGGHTVCKANRPVMIRNNLNHLTLKGKTLPMIAEKEKAQLMVEILDKFAPYMDNSTDLFHSLGRMITNFGTLVESFSDLPEEKRLLFMSFIRLFNQYIEQNTVNYNDLRSFYSFMTSSTNTIIAEYKAAIGLE